MKLCKVIGFATASIKREGLSSYKLLILRPIDDSGRPIGESFLAIDTVGAGLSEIVAVTTGTPALNAVADKNLPVDAAVIAIFDNVTINKKEIDTKAKEG
ncbi:MAG: EutN/CcmL family microcompartment protein [Deltaproteobacteria bacterium]